LDSTCGGTCTRHAGSGHRTDSTLPSSVCIRQCVLKHSAQKACEQSSRTHLEPTTSSKQMGQLRGGRRAAARKAWDRGGGKAGVMRDK